MRCTLSHYCLFASLSSINIIRSRYAHVAFSVSSSCCKHAICTSYRFRKIVQSSSFIVADVVLILFYWLVKWGLLSLLLLLHLDLNVCGLIRCQYCFCEETNILCEAFKNVGYLNFIGEDINYYYVDGDDDAEEVVVDVSVFIITWRDELAGAAELVCEL